MALTARADELFGRDRVAALGAELERMADELVQIYHYPLGIEDEP